MLSQGGQVLTSRDCLSFGPPPTGGASGCGTIENFFNYKATSFNQDRLRLFHYAIFAQKAVTGDSGSGERHGNDFFVTLASLFSLGNDPDVQTGHFVHELGHNLGFTHGDLMSDDQNFAFKPNLPSVMNYTYIDSGVDLDCDMMPDGVYTYSQGTLAGLDESSVDEMKGICDGVPLDMNFATGATTRGDGQYTAGAMDVIGNGDTRDRSDDFDQWGHMLLKFDTSDSRWNNN